MFKKRLLLVRIIIAIVLLQTLRYKFTAHPDSILIFSSVGLEPYGRIGIGVLELIASVLILIPRHIWAGALLSTSIVGGAVGMHLTQIGIEINRDGGRLFYTAMCIFILSAIILFRERKSVPIIGNKL